MTTKDSVIGAIIILACIVIFVIVFFAVLDWLYPVMITPYAFGYVDGNNNGKDDVFEWWNSTMIDTNWTSQKNPKTDYCNVYGYYFNGSSCTHSDEK